MNNEISSKTFSSVAVSLAAIIPVTPIVSIAGSTLLCDITTTVTSTTTTPTPVPTSTSIEKSKSPPTAQAPADNSKATGTKHSMSDAAAKTAGAAAHATGAGAVATATNNATANTNSISNVAATTVSAKKETQAAAVAATEITTTAAATTTTTPSGKTHEATKAKQPEFLLYDLDDGRLKKLLDEAYSYKNPRDKENKSDIFLTLLSQVENEKEDQPYNYRASRYTRNSSSISSTSASYGQQHYPHSHHHKQGGSLQDLSFDAVHNESLLDCDYNFGVGGQRNRRHNRNSRQTKYSSVSSRQREGGSLPSNVNVTNCGSGVGIGQLGGALEQPLFMHDLSGGAIGKQQQQQRRATVAAATTTTIAAAASAITADREKEVLGESSAAIVASLSSTDYVIEMDEPMMDIEQQEHILPCKSQDAATQNMPFYDRLENYDVRIPRVSISGSIQSKIDFAPTRAQTYIDEGVRFTTLERSSASGTGSGGMAADTGSGEIIDSSGMFAVPSTVAALLGGATGKAAASTIASCSASIDAKYLPLDENYKSCKSVLGEKSEMVKTPATSMFSTTKTITRQYDENGNSLNEVYQAGCQAAQAVINASATAAVAGASAVGVNSASSSTTSANAANTGQSQAKAKLKKKSQQERNTKTVDVESVAGYRGKDPVEVLVKYIESTGEDNNNSGKQGDSKSQNNKFNDNTNKKKARKQDKEKQPKMKKSNSLEELRSCAKIDVDDLKRSAATTESNVMLRNKGGAKNNKNNSSSTADINKNFDSKEIATATASTAAVISNKAVTTATNAVTTNSRKGERRSWGTEELQYLGEHHQHNSNNNHEEKSKDKEEKIKDKEDKVKEKEKEKEKDKDKDKKNNIKNKEVQKEQDNKEQKEKYNVSTEKIEKSEKHVNATECHTTSPVSVAKSGDKPPQQQQQPEKPDKQEKQDKRKKSEISLAPSVNSIISVAADVLVMDASVLTPETEEFHVVTKKKKAKKQRASVDETNSGGGPNAIGFNRAHNFTTNMQKSALTGTAATLPQQQQQQARYKYYNYNSNNSNNNTYAYSERVDYFGAYHGNNSNNNYPYQYQQHNQQHHAQQQQHSGNVVVDKSRRKSTSSMPPSEKSDSSDLDSVHSLPIESTTAKSSSSSNNSTSNNKPRHKGNNVAAAAGSNKNAPAPISYAGIAAAAAATQTAPNAASDKWPAVDAANSNHVAAEAANSIEELMAVAAAASGAAAAQISGASAKLKAKKLAHKPDFPELVASAAPAASASTPLEVLAAGKTHAYKPVSYSQRLVAVGAAITTSGSSNDAWINPTPATAAPAAVTVAPVYANDVKEVPKMELIKTELVTVVNTVANAGSSSMRQQATQQPQQAAQQPLQKSKSVEHESYNYNSCNLDLQYPALEKTVKRHSATNVASSPPATTATSAAAAAQFNFAAAAKQQMLANEAMAPVKAASAAAITLGTTLTTSSSNNAATAAAAAVNNSDAIAKKSKEKSPPASDAQLATVAARKHKKDKQQMLETMDITTTAAPKSSTATQTNATSNKQRDGAPAMSNTAAAVSVAVSQSNNNKLYKTQPSQGKGSVLALIAGAVTTATTTNRPAVIILNDDRSLGASNEFTFGDFNEDELKFFDDDLVEEDEQHETEGEGVANEVTEEQQYVTAALQQRQEKMSPTTTSTCFNDSGASSDVVNNTTQQSDDIMLLSGSDACSPNASFAHSQSVGGAVSGSASGNAAGYQSNDSGVYTTTTASGSNKSAKSSSSSNNQKRTSPPTSKGKEAKWNNFLKIPFFNAVPGEPAPEVAIANGDDSTSSDNSCPLPQQLETCNEIETAIISAARAAAEYQQLHKQQPPQQQPQLNSPNSYSNSSSFSSSSSASMDATPPALAGIYPTALDSSNSNQSCQVARRVMPQNDVSDNTCTRSRSNSSGSQRGDAVVLSIQRKEFDIHFIPPPVSTALNLLQHNGIIVDFINSAWEEVAKVTKFYDGQ